ncbi:WW domain-binding protein 11-like [Herpailurus yagouaroundi]|uniref:WW domain-binding protein 11-like n=1 Tax=Herpailurus yagouaroundi TaxID=1608482 RepID=UPI001AD7A977|nr:WW domain-binding protein 11-like [Puma yagouaroundi]
MSICKGQLEDDPRGSFILGLSPRKPAQVRAMGAPQTSLKSDRLQALPKTHLITLPAGPPSRRLGSQSERLRRASEEPLVDSARPQRPPSPREALSAPPPRLTSGASGGGRVGGPRRRPPAIRPAQPHHRAPPLRPPLRARLFRARAAPRLVPPPPAVRVRAGRCGFFSGLRGAPLLAPALAATRFFRGLPGCQALAGCEDAVWTASPIVIKDIGQVEYNFSY